MTPGSKEAEKHAGSAEHMPGRATHEDLGVSPVIRKPRADQCVKTAQLVSTEGQLRADTLVSYEQDLMACPFPKCWGDRRRMRRRTW